jgi:flavodoxin
MKSLIVLHSYHHHNTRKVAEAMARVIGAVIQSPSETNADDLQECDLAGFGSGIDSGKHYKELLDFAGRLSSADGRKCFIFSTSAIQGEQKVASDHACLRELLLSKGYRILGEFSCRGFNTNSFLKVFGGMNKGRPNPEDIQNARNFAESLLSAMN